MARCVDQPLQLMNRTRSAPGAGGVAVAAIRRSAAHSGGSNGLGRPANPIVSRPTPHASRITRFHRGWSHAQSSTRPRGEVGPVVCSLHVPSVTPGKLSSGRMSAEGDHVTAAPAGKRNSAT